MIDGAQIGVHSWAAGGGVEGADLPRGDPQHDLFLDYYRDIEFPNYTEFYFYTLNAAPSSSIHFMTAEEIVRWQIATPVAQSVSGSGGEVVHVGTGGRIAPHHVNVDPAGTAHVVGDAGDTVFTVGSGVTYIDGGAGEDVVVLDGTRGEYTISRAGDTRTVIDSHYERNGVAVLENIEDIRFANDAP